MGRRPLLCIGLLVALILSSGAVAHADNGGYTVRPMTQDEIAQARLVEPDSSPAVSFWQLPLWIQVSFLTGAGASVLVLAKLLPLAFLKLAGRADNQSRDTIYRYIEEHPGCITHDIARDEALNLGSVRYHVYRLELEHRIRLVKAGKFIRFFRNNGTYNEREVVVISALRIRTSRAIVALLGTDPGLSNKQISERLKIKNSSAHRYLQDLARDRIVRCERGDRQNMYYLESDVSDIMKKTGGQWPNVS